MTVTKSMKSGYAPLVPIDLAGIDPARHSKYSPNLYQFLTAPGNKALLARARVFSTKDGTLWMGYLDDRGSLIGNRMSQILCEGSKTKVYSFLPQDYTELANFWTDYAAIGRCAIDTAHEDYFMNAESRWKIEGTTRECRWCLSAKQTLVQKERVVVDQFWQNAGPFAA